MITKNNNKDNKNHKDHNKVSGRTTPKPYKHMKRSTTENNDFYQSKQWRHLRARHIKKQPLCQSCLKRHQVKEADVVDHVIELEDNYDLRLDPKNLQSLCHSCHNQKSSEQRKLRSNGTAEIMKGSDMLKYIQQLDSQQNNKKQ